MAAIGTGMPRRIRRAAGRANWAAGIAVLVWLAFVILPIYLMVKDAIQTTDSYLDGGPLSLPRHFTGHNFVDVFHLGFTRYLINTAIVTVASALLTVLLAFPAAYAIVRSRSRMVSGVFRMFLIGLAIPAQATIIPVFLLITRMHLYDSLTAIVLPTVAFGLPLSVLVLASALRDVPRELYEAMTLDGGGSIRLLWSLALPLSRASLVTVSIYCALNAWNGFLFPLILTQSNEQRVQTLGLYNFQGEFTSNIPGLMAAVLLSALPIFVVYLFARRWLIAGLAGVGGK
ncbi:carbohydrate ABC transporter permease [Actinoallomurus bryophytorum]|uniref:Xylobiose transport system permease protein n=1 Tax=Actinoallomurus bryophytorum TaxID=1490222 RepID=A0A543CLC3_9ACTN|nr:carbohydrate ABC transporter permease [Actinoallomurus bryophytorum]TQL97903.1 xylobiose transport system permease protein [Actinoallomurus bryophytorum]